MRNQYTPIFRRVLTTRVWAQPHATVRVYLWAKLVADPEGFIAADLTGVALGAHVSGQEAREAVAFLESVDPDAHPDDPEQGRLLAKVDGGWQVVGQIGERELAKRESQKASNRSYMRRRRAQNKAANDTSSPPVERERVEPEEPESATEPVAVSTAAPQPSEVEPPKPRPKSNTNSEVGTPLPPTPPSVDSLPGILHRIPETWSPSESLRSAAAIAGVQRFDEHIQRLRLGPIGGSRGVFTDQLEAYIGSMLGKMRTWEEIDRAKAPVAPPKPPHLAPYEPPLPPSVDGAPPWVLRSHAAFAKAHGYKLAELAKKFATSFHKPVREMKTAAVAEAFTHFLLTYSAEAA